MTPQHLLERREREWQEWARTRGQARSAFGNYLWVNLAWVGAVHAEADISLESDHPWGDPEYIRARARMLSGR